MKTIALNKMLIKNFKGIQDLEIKFDGKNTLISGYNGVGKSTVADAYLWTVTGKNMASATRFEVRPRDEQGNEIHDVITSVQCEFSVVDENGDAFTFTVKRDELEDLTKKEREQLKSETIAQKKSYYFIDNAPYDAKTFYAQIEQIICDKDKLAILSNPFAFFTLDESKQREMLTVACGDIADSDIESYAEIKEICGAINTPIAVRDSLKKTVKATEKRLDEIPARISGLAELCDEYADYDKQIAELKKEQSEVLAQGEKLKDELIQSVKTSAGMLPKEPSDNELERVKLHLDTAQMCLDNQTRKLQEAFKQRDQSKCPNCGYMLNDNSFKIDLIKKEVKEAKKDLEKTQILLSEKQVEYDAAMQEYNAKVTERAQVDETSVQQRKNLETCIEKLRERYTELSVAISKFEQAKDAQAKIKALRDEQRTLDDRLADDMTKLDIITKFLMRKASAVVENINNRFTVVKFKLFEMQTNGELKPCCKATKDGVSYANINTASKVQIGIELANLFSQYIGVIVPLWIDSRESVIDLPPTHAQTICLKVDEQYKELHIEAV